MRMGGHIITKLGHVYGSTYHNQVHCAGKGDECYDDIRYHEADPVRFICEH
jgi:hypothetical protein